MRTHLLVVLAVSAMAAPKAHAVCTMPAGTIEMYAGPGSHNFFNGDICDYNAKKKTWDMCSFSGWLYKPVGVTGKRPVFAYIQGSSGTSLAPAKDQTQFCYMIDYFVQQKFIVWVPYTRGYSDKTKAKMSDASGAVIITNSNSTAGFTNSGKYIGGSGSAQTTLDNMRDEVNNEISWSIDWLIKTYPSDVDADAIVLAGHSFGGATTTLAADQPLAKKLAAIVDMSGGVLSWYDQNNQPRDAWKKSLRDAANGRSKPMVFIQVLNETPVYSVPTLSLVDKVASTQEVFDAALKSASTTPAEMMIYSPISRADLTSSAWCSAGTVPNLCAHVTFITDPQQVQRWAPQVKDFLLQIGIKP